MHGSWRKEKKAYCDSFFLSQQHFKTSSTMSYKSYLRSHINSLLDYIYSECADNGGAWETIHKHREIESKSKWVSEWGKWEKVRNSQQWRKKREDANVYRKAQVSFTKNRSGIHLNIILYCISNRLDTSLVCSQQCLKQFAFSCRRQWSMLNNMEIKGEATTKSFAMPCRAVLYCDNSLFLIMLWLDDIVWKIIIIIRPKYNVDFTERFHLSIRS